MFFPLFFYYKALTSVNSFRSHKKNQQKNCCLRLSYQMNTNVQIMQFCKQKRKFPIKLT